MSLGELEIVGGNSEISIEVLVGEEELESIGADEELLSIVIDELRPLTERPHAEILDRLIGTGGQLQESTAQRLWVDALAHRKSLSDALSRSIHLRTALFDLLASRGLKPGMKIAELLEQKSGADELTGVLRPDVFEALVEHQAHQRTKEPAVIACVSVLAHGINGFDTLGEQEILASLALLARKRFRRSDAIGVVNGRTLSLLLVQCQPEKAAALLRQLDADLRQTHPSRPLRLASGVTSLEQGAVPRAALERALQRMEQWTQSLPKEASQALWPLGIFATTSVQRFLEVHEYFAERGWALLMASDRATADQAARKLNPAVLLADVMLPPSGGVELLEMALRAKLPSAGFLVAPASWSSLLRGKGLSTPTLQMPLIAPAIQPHLEKHLGPARAPIGPLSGERDAQALATALQTLLTGWRLPAHLQDAVGGRPELQVAQARLSSAVPSST